MKIFLITNLFPKVSNPNSGIFIVQRFKHYKTYGVNIDAVSPAYENSKSAVLLKKLLKKQDEEYPLEKHEGVKFKPVLINRNLRMVLMNKISRSYFVKIADQFAEAIER
jgi:hypothetical protein